jgi:hypothetical protein
MQSRFMLFQHWEMVNVSSWRVKRPNDPSSATAERGAVAAWWSEVKAYELEKKVARTRRVQARIVAIVTRGAVRCSAWLGDGWSSLGIPSVDETGLEKQNGRVKAA